MGASSDHQDSSPSGKLLHCTPEFNEPLRGSPSGLPTFSFLSEKCGVRAHFYNMIKYTSFQENPGGSADPGFQLQVETSRNFFVIIKYELH